LSLFSGHLEAQNVDGFLRTNGIQIQNNSNDNFIIRGMGPGGWMLQEGYMFGTKVGTQHEIRAMLEDLTDKATTDSFYDAWLANFFTRQDVELVSQWGFNSIRVPLHYNLFTLPIEEEPVEGQNTWLEKGFSMVDDLLAWCEDNDLYLILDLHAAPGGQGKNADISDYDPSKPSLWESEFNRSKTVALWRKLAERYSDREHIGGYDLINEPNWGFEGDTGNENGCGCQENIPLENLYVRLIDAIREVDQDHLIFIEGNCWANNFSGLEELADYDSNLSFSFHKYWNYNTESAINDLLQMRSRINVPLFLGETGENSNTWFTDMVKLMENLDIGWATWAYKQIDIDDPFTIISDKWDAISNYDPSTGGNRPSYAVAKEAMDDMTQKLLTENCQFNPGVVHALLEAPFGAPKKAFKDHSLPGTIFATDYDMGEVSDAWYDLDYQNLHVSTGEYTAWNQGYLYRNDGVDIEKCNDAVSNGYNMGWTNNGEWLRYTLSDITPGTYNVTFRVAGNSGKINLKVGNTTISEEHITTPNTGGYQNWEDVTIENVVVSAEADELTFYIINGGMNVNYIRFDLVQATSIQDEVAEKKTSIIKTVSSVPGGIRLLLENPGQQVRRIDAISCLDIRGRLVEHIDHAFELSGFHEIFFNQKLSHSLYVIRLRSEGHFETVKIIH
jgi:endoglucanase